MIIVMASARKEDVDHVVSRVEELGYQAHVIQGVERTVVAAVGDERGKERLTSLEALPYVEQVIRVLKPFKLAGREVKKEDTVVSCASTKIGGTHFGVMAGPCSIESEQQIQETAEAVKAAGATILRGGAFKPRTSPYSFQGLEMEGLRILRRVGKSVQMPVVTEATTPEQVPVVAQYADMIQIGARNMQNYGLLRAVGKAQKPVLLKRGMMCTINEFLMSAEYILSEGNPNVILCERGIRTFETETRNTLDLQAVPVIKLHSHLPIIVDPSHAAGRWDIVIAMACAAVAAGADGILLEVHPDPANALSDGLQSLTFRDSERLVSEMRAIAGAIGRSM